jgi:hypothetical protein
MIVNVNYNNTLTINLPKDCFHRYIKGWQTILVLHKIFKSKFAILPFMVHQKLTSIIKIYMDWGHGLHVMNIFYMVL